MNTKPISQAADDYTNQAADVIDSGLRSTQRAANNAINALSDTVGNVRDRAAPVIGRVAGQVGGIAKRGMDTAREKSTQLRDRAAQASDTTVGYIKDEPVKSILMAAAAGAALMILVKLVTGPRDRY